MTEEPGGQVGLMRATKRKAPSENQGLVQGSRLIGRVRVRAAVQDLI